MSAQIKSKSNLINRSLSVALTWLLLVGISFGCLQTLRFEPQKPADSVYCPLLKTFLAKDVSFIKLKKTLHNVCATDKQKETFLFEAAQKFPLLRFISDSDQLEKLFFDYLKKGKAAFSTAVYSRNIPERESIKFGAAEKVAGHGNFQIDNHQLTAHVVLPQRPRPPTIARNIFYSTNAAPQFKTISRRIQPRAPPVSTV